MYTAPRLSMTLAVLLALALPAAPAQIAGTLDTGFGNLGLATVLGPNASIYALEAQSTGKLIAAGRQGDQWAVARVTSGGSLDTTFGSSGEVLLFGAVGMDWVHDLVIDSQDRILLVGRQITGRAAPFTTVRLLPDGALDSSFGDNGIAETTIGKGGVATGIVIQPDGKIVVGGYAYAKKSYAFALARYLPDGTLDCLTLRGLAVHDGKIYSSGRCFDTVDPIPGFDAFVVRHLADGSLDPTFGSGGVARTVAPEEDQGLTLLVQPEDGRILVSSSFSAAPQTGSMVAWRFDTDGTLDTTFGPGLDGLSELAGSLTGGPFGMCFERSWSP